MTEQPNIIFLVLDTARARSISPYKESGARTPFLSDLANNNIKFDQAISPAPWTLPAHVSMFTGLTPSEHQVNSWEDRLSEESTTLAGLLSQNGYQTVGFSHNMWLSNTFGLDTGFQDFNEQWQVFQNNTNLFKTAHNIQGLSLDQKIRQLADDILSSNPLINIVNAFYGKFIHNRYDHGARQTNKNIGKWLKKEWNSSNPFFLFANYLEPHIEYDPPEKFARRYCDGFTVAEAKNVSQKPINHNLGQDQLSSEDLEMLEALYKGEIDYLDKKLKDLFQILSQEDALEDSLIIIVGDHGENLGQSGLMSHMYSLHENLIRVPFIAKTPDNIQSEVTELVQTHDLFKLCLYYAGIEDLSKEVDSQLPPPLGTGREYVVSELLAENPPEDAVKRETNGQYDIQKFNKLRKYRRIIRSGSLKYESIIDGPNRLYEVNGFTEKIIHNEDSTELERQLSEYVSEKKVKTTTEESNLEGNIEGKLKDLGYL